MVPFTALSAPFLREVLIPFVAIAGYVFEVDRVKVVIVECVDSWRDEARPGVVRGCVREKRYQDLVQIKPSEWVVRV
jgi:hypothetical protein